MCLQALNRRSRIFTLSDKQFSGMGHALLALHNIQVTEKCRKGKAETLGLIYFAGRGVKACAQRSFKKHNDQTPI